MKRRIPVPCPHAMRRGYRVAHLAAAIAAAWAVGAPAVAGETPHRLFAVHARAHPDGGLSWSFQPQVADEPLRPKARLASTLPVTSCADDGSPGTLRSAVDAAIDGDTIDLTHLTCSRIDLVLGRIESRWDVNDLTIRGPGRDALTIDGGGSDGVFVHGSSGVFDLRDLSIAHGRLTEEWGACVSSPGGNVRLSGVRVASCEAHQITGARGAIQGGAVFAFGNVTLEDSEILDSTASSETPGGVPDDSGEGITTYPAVGGGIATITGDIALHRSRISGNSAVSTAAGGIGEVRGGGLYTHVGNIVITDSVLVGNRVSSGFTDMDGYRSFAAGGALAVSGTLTVTASTIADNVVESSADIVFQRGGGIAATGAATTIENTTIENNHTTGDGGGLHHQGAALTMVNSTLSGNAAERGAGGLYDVSPTALEHVTIAFNHSGAQIGGAVLLHGGDVRDSIVSRNGTDGEWAADLFVGAAMMGGRNLIGDAGRAELPADTLRSDPLLLPLADNGGPTRTHALDSASPAVDAGSSAKNLSFDQRGTGFKRDSGAAPDIGAFEVQQLPPEAVFADGFDRGFGSGLR